MSMSYLEISFRTTSASYRFRVSTQSHFIINLDTFPPTAAKPNVISVRYFTRCIFS